MKKSSIYPNRSRALLALFEKAGKPSKLMCVPIDYAKKDHSCNIKITSNNTVASTNFLYTLTGQFLIYISIFSVFHVLKSAKCHSLYSSN